MIDYDQVADTYDGHFARPVDAWEDTLLADLLRPYVNDQRVLDLGCGTGWLLDNLRPSAYLGMDPSHGMLARFEEKYPEGVLRQVDVHPPIPFPATEQTVMGAMAAFHPDVITSTWAAHDLDVAGVMAAAIHLHPGGIVALHGSGPAYARREHYVMAGPDADRKWDTWTPRQYRRDYEGLRHIGEAGTGASDNIADHGSWRNHVAVTQTELHYGILSVWRRTP